MDISQECPTGRFRSREALVRFVLEQGATRKAAAAAFRVSAKTAAKWVARYRQLAACRPDWIAARVRTAVRARQFFH